MTARSAQHSSSTSSLLQFRLVADDGPNHPHRLAALALRSRSTKVLDALVECAGGGIAGIEPLRHVLRGGDVPPSMLTSSTGPYSVALATVLAGLRPGSPDAELGLTLTCALVEQDQQSWWWRRASMVAVQNAVICGAYDAAEPLLEHLPELPMEVQFGTRADLLNPFLRGRSDHDRDDFGADGPQAKWERSLSYPFVRAGLAPLRLNRAAGTPFDGLGSASEPGSIDGPLVTVVMPTYAPDDGLVTSVRSLLAQSYGNLEILLVDDSSPTRFTSRYEHAAALDPRITLLRMSVNGGSYLARNAAMAQATGQFITFQDGDDWSHPERIARQVRTLVEHPEAPASMSRAVRATDELGYTWLGFSPQRDNASSLMLTRATLDRLGPFQRVRKGADSEYHKRIQAVLGELSYVRQALAVTRLRSGSLSRADFTLDWHTPDRVNYRNVFGHWHRTRAASDVPLSADRTAQPFPPPRSFVHNLPGEPPRPRHFRLGLLVDASLPNPLSGLPAKTPGHQADEIPAVIHREDFTLARQLWQPFADEFLELVQTGAVDLISTTDEVHLTTLVVLSPGAMELRDDVGVAFSTDQVVVVVPLPDQQGRFFDLMEVADTCVHLFGHKPRWAARTSDVQRSWLEDGWDLPLLEELLMP